MHTYVLSGLFSSGEIKETIGRAHLSENSCTVHLWEPEIGPIWDEFQKGNIPRLLNGVIENGLRMTFVNLTPLSASSNLESGIYSFDAKAVIIGREKCDPQAEVFSSISFKTTDTDKIFYALPKQTTSSEVTQDSRYYWKDDYRQIGVIRPPRGPRLQNLEMEDSQKKPKIVIQFPNPKSLQDAFGEMDKVCDFLSIICGKTQFCGEVRVHDSKCQDGEWDVHLGYVRPRPESTSISKVGSNSMLVNPYLEKDQFGKILCKWLKGDDDTSPGGHVIQYYRDGVVHFTTLIG